MPTRAKLLTIADLDRITSILGAQLKLRLVPGTAWLWDRRRRMLMFPRDAILAMNPNTVIGYLWRTVQHAISTHGIFKEYDVAVDAVCATEAAGGARVMHPHWVLQLVLAAERERVETIARRAARNLGNSYLPVRGGGHRAAELEADKTALADLTPDPKAYWARAATALGGIASGALTLTDLPADMPWSETLCAAIRALTDLPTYDELLSGVEGLVPELVRAWIASMVPPQPQPEPENEPQPETPDAGDDDDGSDVAGDEPDDASATPEPAEDTETPDPAPTPETDPSAPEAGAPKTADPDEDAAPGPGGDDDAAPEGGMTLDELLDQLGDDLKEAISQAIEELGDAAEGIDFFEEEIKSGTPAATHEAPAETWSAKAPPLDTKGGISWGAVARASTNVVESLRRVLLEHLVENDIGEMQYGTKNGRIDARRVIRPMQYQNESPFRRRTQPEDRSYAIALVLDRSGSMSSSTEGEPLEEAFGVGPLRRWHLTARLAVGFIEALQRLESPSLQTAIVTYDGDVELIKSVNDRLTPAIKQNVMDTIQARGDNDDAGALTCALNDLAKSRADMKMIIHLTDGEFCSSTSQMEKVARTIVQAGVELVILTLDISSSNAKRFVPGHLADEINDATLSRILSKHLHRMLAA